jgi:hypothetical protein
MKSLLVGVLVLIPTLTIQAIAIMAIVRLVVRLLRSGFAGRSFCVDVAIMLAVLLITLASILAQIAVWASAFLACGALGDFNTAFYHSAVNFTTLGYGDIVMSHSWRLLGPLEAANGVLMCGISASGLFAVTDRLIKTRLQAGEKSGPQE